MNYWPKREWLLYLNYSLKKDGPKLYTKQQSKNINLDDLSKKYNSIKTISG